MTRPAMTHTSVRGQKTQRSSRRKQLTPRLNNNVILVLSCEDVCCLTSVILLRVLRLFENTSASLFNACWSVLSSILYNDCPVLLIFLPCLCACSCFTFFPFTVSHFVECLCCTYAPFDYAFCRTPP